MASDTVFTDARIIAAGVVSREFLKTGIIRFHGTCQWVYLSPCPSDSATGNARRTRDFLMPQTSRQTSAQRPSSLPPGAGRIYPEPAGIARNRYQNRAPRQGERTGNARFRSNVNHTAERCGQTKLCRVTSRGDFMRPADRVNLCGAGSLEGRTSFFRSPAAWNPGTRRPA